MKRLLILVLLTVCTAVANPAFALCYPLGQVSANDPYTFLQAVASALTSAKAGRDVVLQQPGKPDPTGYGLMLALTTAQDDMACGISQLKPFTKSANQAIYAGALGISTGLLGLRDDTGRIVSLYKGILDTGKLPPAGDRFENEANIEISVVKDWQILYQGLTVATYSVRALNPETNKMSNMVLTAAQRETLAAQFSAIAKRGPKSSGNSEAATLETRAAMVAEFFRNPAFKSISKPSMR